MKPTNEQILNAVAHLEGECPEVAGMLQQMAAQPADENLLEARAYADQRWDGENVPVEWLRHFVDGLGNPPSPPIAGIGVAVIGHKHFGNPIPAAWYAAAKELLAQGFAPTQQAVEPVGVTSEQRRLIGVIADKIEDGTLFQAGIYSRKDLARFVRNMLDTQPTRPQTAEPAEQDLADLIAGGLQVSRGTAYELMRKALAEQPEQPEQQATEWMAVASSAVLALKDAASWLPDGQNKRTVALSAEHIQKRARALYSPTQPVRQPLTDDTRRLDAIAENSWDLRCFDMPTGADDADIGWRVIEHHMAKPNERTVAEVFRDDPRQAIDAAIEAAHGITGSKT